MRIQQEGLAYNTGLGYGAGLGYDTGFVGLYVAEARVDIEGTEELEALNYALLIYAEDTVGLEPTVPFLIPAKSVVRAANLALKLPTANNRLRREIKDLRNLTNRTLRSFDFGRAGEPRLATFGDEAGLALNSLVHLSGTERSSHGSSVNLYRVATNMVIGIDSGATALMPAADAS